MKRKRPNHLRLVPGGGGKKPSPEIMELDEISPEAVREAFVVRFGPECAAWLVRRFRRQIRRYGAFAMHLPPGAALPPWCDIALSFLKKRAKKWSVVVRSQAGEKHYRVLWLGGPRGPRELPDALRRLN